MEGQRPSLWAIWTQTQIPVIYHRGLQEPMMIRLPYASDNGVWLKKGHKPQPQWSQPFQCWLAPKAWFDDVISRALQRFGRVYVIQPFRERQKCVPLCWNARGFDCDCSCMGKNHGVNTRSGNWYMVSESFATKRNDRELGVRLLRRKTGNKHRGLHLPKEKGL